ncbi:MAG: glycosyltransferase [Bacteroidia bacterium]|nr:glycosyltransferase [Bacteroidia bacterium]
MPRLHLVSFNIPYPPDQGGLVDVYAKICALKEAGAEVVLHCYEYNRAHAPELEKYCAEVHYYPRHKNLFSLFSLLPFIVFSRRSATLEKYLSEAKNDEPVLLEGLHTAYYLGKKALQGKKVWLRTHNVEHRYYAGLADAEPGLLKKWFFRLEAFKLKRFEPILSAADGLFCISAADEQHFRIHNKNTSLVSAFHLENEVRSQPGLGNFAMYHGSLDVPENYRAALWLVNEVFAESTVPLHIVGNRAPAALRAAIDKHPHIRLMENAGPQQIQEMMTEAQVHVLPTFQATGIKLKLLHALFAGRFCIVNPPMVLGTGLEEYCTLAGDAAEMRYQVEKYMQLPFTESDLQARKKLNESIFANRVGARTVLAGLGLAQDAV